MLPSVSPHEFDALCQAPETLLAFARTLAAHLRLAGEVTALPGGSNFVAAVGPWNVIKLFPPFQRFQWEAEAQTLKALSDHRLPVTIPQYRDSGVLDGWGYVAMSRLEGTSLAKLWPAFDEAERCHLLTEIGQLMAAVHELPKARLPVLDPPWEMFWTHQRSRCLARQASNGLPERLLQSLPAWLEQVPELATFSSRVVLTGEYTPENLLVRLVAGQWRLTGMYDFGDSRLGPAHYDWVGPVTFLVQGQRDRLEAFLKGYGALQAALTDEALWRRELLAHLLLHAYSNLEAQLHLPDWQSAATWDELALRIWPEQSIMPSDLDSTDAQ